MNLQRAVWFYLWVAPHVLLIVVAILMFRKGLHKDFPIFFSYLLFEFLQFCLLFSLYCLTTPGSMYTKIDMFGRAGSIALHFGILREMFESPLANNVPLRRTMARMLNWVTAFLVVLAAVFIGSIYYSMVGYRVLQAYVSIEAFNTAQCGLLVLVFLWHRFLGLRMSPFVFGIALGMGLVAGLEPLMHALKDSVSAQNSRIVDGVQFASFHGAVLIWLYFALAREKIRPDSRAVPLLQAQEWAADLRRITGL